MLKLRLRIKGALGQTKKYRAEARLKVVGHHVHAFLTPKGSNLTPAKLASVSHFAHVCQCKGGRWNHSGQSGYGRTNILAASRKICRLYATYL